VLYRAEIPGGFLFVKAASLHYVFYDTKALSRIHANTESNTHTKIDFAQPANDLIQAHGIAVLFLQANPGAVVEAVEKVLKRRITSWAMILHNGPQMCPAIQNCTTVISILV
jgi:hypothetical protein